MEETVKLGYSSPGNVTLEGTYDTRIPRDQRGEMSYDEYVRNIDDAFTSPVNIWPVE